MFTSTKTPLFNSSALDSILKAPLQLDEQNLFRPLEVILFEGSPIKIHSQMGSVIEITTPAYPLEAPLFTDMRFLSPHGNGVKRTLPSISDLQLALEERVGACYIWGGNFCKGLDAMAEFFPPQETLTAFQRERFYFRGCDCSGLLYEVTGGLVPRNVSWLLKFGERVNRGERVEPLDLILWPGHVVIVLDSKRTIESHAGWGGVVVKEIDERFAIIEKERGSDFQIRRFHPETLRKYAL